MNIGELKRDTEGVQHDKKWQKITWSVVGRIPSGKVATYGQIAKIVGTTPRLIGQALHKNPDPKNIPCHRVVDRNGRVASGYAFGGAKEQRKKLVEEGVTFIDAMHVDLRACLWQAKSEARSTKSETNSKSQ